MHFKILFPASHRLKLDGDARVPPSTPAELFWLKCLQSDHQTSPPTLRRLRNPVYAYKSHSWSPHFLLDVASLYMLRPHVKFQNLLKISTPFSNQKSHKGGPRIVLVTFVIGAHARGERRSKNQSFLIADTLVASAGAHASLRPILVSHVQWITL